MPLQITNSRSTPLTIGGLSQQTGVLVETIRYYEQIGFMPQPRRSANGRRVYDLENIKRLRFIKRSRDMGFTQNEVRNLLGLADGGAKSCGDVQMLAEGHLKEIRMKINDLMKLESILAVTVAKCIGDGTVTCPVLDALNDG